MAAGLIGPLTALSAVTQEAFKMGVLGEGMGLVGGAFVLMAATATTLIIYSASNSLLDDAFNAFRAKV